MQSKYNIFFSWQSDVNTKEIKKCVENEINKLKNKGYDIEYSYYPCGDIAGSPNIANIVKKKIKSSDVFIADLTNVGTCINENKNKKYQNSNVCYELGIADAFLNSKNIIILTENNSMNDIFFDINHNRMTPYKYENGQILCSGLSSYIESCFMESSNKKNIELYNNTCFLCLDDIDINSYKKINELIICEKCYLHNPYDYFCNNVNQEICELKLFVQKNKTEKLFNIYEKNAIKKYIIYSFDLNIDFDVVLYEQIKNYLFASDLKSEYFMQYLIIFLNIFKNHNLYFKIINNKNNGNYDAIMDIYKWTDLFFNIFSVNTKKNNIIKYVLEYITELIFYTLDKININELIRNKKYLIDHLFACCVLIYSYLDWKEKIEFKERFNNIWQLNFDEIYEKEKIIEQIITYGYMLSKHQCRDLFEYYENKVFKQDEKNWLPVPMFKPRNDIKWCI